MDMRNPSVVVLVALVLVAGLSVTATATWAACRWWYGRKLKAAEKRLHKSDQGRLFSQQQTLQARQQIEALKKELDAHRQALSTSEADRQRTRELERALAMAERAAVLAIEGDTSPGRLGHHGTNGFADTQIMS